jgi:hypothetical protein
VSDPTTVQSTSADPQRATVAAAGASVGGTGGEPAATTAPAGRTERPAPTAIPAPSQPPATPPPPGGAATEESSEPPALRIEDAAEALPDLALLAARAWLHAAAWGIGSSVRLGERLARAAVDPAAAAELYEEASRGLREQARVFLGIDELDEQVRTLAPLAGTTLGNGARRRLDLRAHGEELLRRSADVDFDEQVHPAYARILTELAPDEARILRLLATDGPQPVIDVRAGNLIGLGSQLIAQSLNMLDLNAGLRHHDRVPAYLNNLARLGLIELSDDPLGGPADYQVLEAQPDVLQTIKETPRARTVHRSLRLSAFGRDFCVNCLPLEPAALPPAEEPAQLPPGAAGRAPHP